MKNIIKFYIIMENKYNLLDIPLISYTHSTNNKLELNIILTEEEIKKFLILFNQQ